MIITGSGMVTSVGVNTASTCAAITAGVSGIRRGNIWDSSGGDFLSVGRPELHQWWEGDDFLALLAATAARECLAEMPGDDRAEEIPLFVLLPPAERPCTAATLSDTTSSLVADELRDLPVGRVFVARRGSTGLLAALASAEKLFQRREARSAIIVGVETYLRQKIVDHYIRERRVLTPENSNGFVPGEAACAVLVSARGKTGSTGVRILGKGYGRESGLIGNTDVFTGDGLSDAVEEPLARAILRWPTAIIGLPTKMVSTTRQRNAASFRFVSREGTPQRRSRCLSGTQ